jgi:yeast amino acid transporter
LFDFLYDVNATNRQLSVRPLQPYLAYWGVFWTLVFTLITGFEVFFGKFNVADFFTACAFFFLFSFSFSSSFLACLVTYARAHLCFRIRGILEPRIIDVNIPIFAGLYIFWKLYKRTRVWKPLEMDFVTVRRALYFS